VYFDLGATTRFVAAMDGEGGEVDRMEDGDESSDGDASDTELLQQITELEVAVSSVGPCTRSTVHATGIGSPLHTAVSSQDQDS